MSLQAMVNVIERCPEKGGEYTALLALANRADELGRNIWYDPERIAFESRQTTKNLEVVLGKLLARGRVSIEPGAGPRGMDLIHLHLPPHKLTRERWAELTAARVADKRAAGKTRLGKPRARKNVELGTRNEDFSQAQKTELGTRNEDFSQAETVDSGTKIEDFSEIREKSSQENTLPARPSADFPAPYSPLQSLKEVVIELASDPLPAESASEAAPAGGPDQTNDDNLGDWTEEDDRLFGDDLDLGEQGTPDGVAPDGAGLVDLSDSQEPAEGLQDAQTATGIEQVPAARRAAAEPGSAEYERLVALCGGSVKNPNLTGLLGELTRGGNSRRLWLTLSLDEIEQAREYAQARRAEVPFRTGLLEALDAAVDGDAPTPPRARLTFRDHEQAPRPGDGDTAPKANPWQVRQRVRLDGDKLGVVVGVNADARQASVTVDLDSGQRVSLVGTQFRRLSDAPDAPSAPSAAHPLVGTAWQLASTGKIVTVTDVRLGSPVTDDGTKWPPFGAASLSRMATQVEANAPSDHGAA
ncbi:hypothetical protein [Deinococcus sp. UR1]|uniref:hypothetical protein n=1 Tax=Deinococcus sp. UR1 TaxID=1704277 RepID=UPI0018EB5654|nr:hypothetical protein [Deinococcus sp. UR1]